MDPLDGLVPQSSGETSSVASSDTSASGSSDDDAVLIKNEIGDLRLLKDSDVVMETSDNGMGSNNQNEAAPSNSEKVVSAAAATTTIRIKREQCAPPLADIGDRGSKTTTGGIAASESNLRGTSGGAGYGLNAALGSNLSGAAVGASSSKNNYNGINAASESNPGGATFGASSGKGTGPSRAAEPKGDGSGIRGEGTEMVVGAVRGFSKITSEFNPKILDQLVQIQQSTDFDSIFNEVGVTDSDVRSILGEGFGGLSVYNKVKILSLCQELPVAIYGLQVDTSGTGKSECTTLAAKIARRFIGKVRKDKLQQERRESEVDPDVGP